jgi:hypothetical protein
MILCSISLRQSGFASSSSLGEAASCFTLLFVLRLYLSFLFLHTANVGFACSDSSIQPPASQNHSAFAGQSFGPGGIRRLD